MFKLEINKLHADLLVCESEEEKIKCNTKIKKAQASLLELEFVSLCDRSGPVCSHLDKVLDKHKITPQAYHNRVFVGNHCHKYLTCKVYKDLTEDVITHTQLYTQNQDIINIALITRYF